MGRPFVHTPRGITLLAHLSGPPAYSDGRSQQKPVRIPRRRRRTGPGTHCRLDARYVRELELRLRRMERIAEVNRRLALTDPLTGLPNRRHLELHLDHLLADGGLRRFSMALFDVDDFKRFNDRHGYVAGDRALIALSSVLSKAFPNSAARLGRRDLVTRPTGGKHAAERPGSIVRHRHPHHFADGASHFAARLGGDEFVVAFVDAQVRRVRDAADRMARTTGRHPLFSPHGVTVSFGVATMSGGMRRWRDLLAAADRDLRRRRSAARRLPADRGFR